jgi:hypothetical protein
VLRETLFRRPSSAQPDLRWALFVSLEHSFPAFVFNRDVLCIKAQMPNEGDQSHPSGLIVSVSGAGFAGSPTRSIIRQRSVGRKKETQYERFDAFLTRTTWFSSCLMGFGPCSLQQLLSTGSIAHQLPVYAMDIISAVAAANGSHLGCEGRFARPSSRPLDMRDWPLPAITRHPDPLDHEETHTGFGEEGIKGAHQG